VGDRPPRDLSRQALAEVVEPRYEELFTLVQSELRRSGFEDLVAAGIVLTGGTAKMEGAVELAEEIFHMPVRLAKPQGIRGLEAQLSNPIYATVIGLLHYARKDHGPVSPVTEIVEYEDSLRPPKRSAEGRVFTRLKNWLQGNF
jgi:cell division protein FtsA